MDVTSKCTVSAKHGFEANEKNKFAVFEVIAKNGDTIKVNEIDGIRYIDLVAAYESPKHRDHLTIDFEDLVIMVGGEEKKSERTICVIGK